jgi:hypothetical protein
MMIFLLIIAVLFIFALAFAAYKVIATKKFSFSTVVVLIIALLGIGFVGYVSYGLFNMFVVLPNQGKLVNVLPDTTWINDNSELLFLQERSLYSITLRGTDKKKISDVVDEYAISPDGQKVALWYRVKPADSYENTMMRISIIDLKRNEVQVAEKERNCGHPIWLADSSGVAYSFDNNYTISIFKTEDQTKKILAVPRMVRGLAVTKDKSKLAYASLFDKKYYVFDFVSQAVSEISAKDPYAVDLDKDVDRGFWKGVRNVPFKTSDGKMELYNKKGSLWFKHDNQNDLLVQYEGQHDDKMASGIQPIALSPNEQYVAFEFKGKIYICDILSKKSGFLTDGYGAEFLNVSEKE